MSPWNSGCIFSHSTFAWKYAFNNSCSVRSSFSEWLRRLYFWLAPPATPFASPDDAREELPTRPCYFATHCEGFHPEASGSFLKCELVMNGSDRYWGSVTIVVTTSHIWPLGALKLSKYSSRIAVPL